MTRLAVLLTEGFADWECAHLMGAGRAHFGFEITVVTPDGGAVTSAGGLRVLADRALKRLDPADFDALVLCGGAAWESAATPDAGDAVRGFARAGKLIGAICAATLALAGAGLLDEVSHTSNRAGFLASVPLYRGAARYVDTPAAVRDGRIVTAPGTAPVSFMAEIFRALGFGGGDLDVYTGLLAAEHTVQGSPR